VKATTMAGLAGAGLAVGRELRGNPGSRGFSGTGEAAAVSVRRTDVSAGITAPARRTSSGWNQSQPMPSIPSKAMTMIVKMRFTTVSPA